MITLDDGYADNLWYAKPLLEKYDCPATVFVVSGYIGKNRELTSDELERIVLETPRLPEKLCLTIAGQAHTWELGDTEAQFIAWDVLREDYPTPRHRCYHDLHGLLRPMDQNGREQVLKALRDWSGDLSGARPQRRAMDGDEIRELVKGHLIDVGAHTVNHLLLAAQEVEVQKREIMSSKEYLEDILGRCVTAFAYPYGGATALNSQTVQLVRDADFHLACDNVPGCVNIKTDPFLLPRHMIFNWTGDEFAQRLESFFGS
ncbi:MAG: polysaccharide deacetylase family protein [Syntrophales bacterium LBB04]|nr:polysaccharide deacetylase family protein [Syntrophales bacterium LBB04]